MNFRIDENAVRASVAAAYAAKSASHPGEALSTQELRAIALDALIDAMLTPPNGLIYEALTMIGSGAAAALERAENRTGIFTNQPESPPRGPIRWAMTTSNGRRRATLWDGGM
jgi:hypothetical protein